VIHVDFSETPDRLFIEMIPKAAGRRTTHSQDGDPAEGVDAIKTFVIDCVIAAGAKRVPDDRRGGHRRHVGPVRRAREACGARELGTSADRGKAEANLRRGQSVGPQGLGGD
jgi:fumarate hydratase subunit alpha/L(+)-tartrate dehydratase alpha subunit